MIRLTPLVCLIGLLLGSTLAAAEWRYDDVGRVVALSDVHGAFEPMLLTLRNADVIDDTDTWIAGNTHLVIVGDLLDRGPDSRKAMDLLMRLEGEAEKAGGQVHVLIGNHEVMNLVGDLRYVSRAEYAAFAADESDRERERWFDAYLQRNGGEDVDTDALRARFEDSFPRGFFALRRALSPNGRYGRWLLSKPLLVVINRTAFVHGGLSPLVGGLGLDGVNGAMKDELIAYLNNYTVLERAGVLLPTDSFYDHETLLEQYLPSPSTSSETLAAADAVRRLGRSDLHALDGPLWYRGNVACSRLVEEDRLLATLAAIDADRVVVGHTPTPSRRVLERFDGRVLEVDTGMLSDYYGGRGHALIMIGDVLGVVSEASDEITTVSPHPRQVGARPDGFMTAEEVEQLLLDGEIVGTREDERKHRIVTVTDGNRTLDAVFRERAARGFYPDVAAYRLDRMLELDAVPVTVMRRVSGDYGSLQFLPEGVIDEAARSESGRGGSASCPLDVQWSAMYVFDSLIYNEARTTSRMTYSPDQWQLVLVGHRNAFGTSSGRPRYLEPVPLDVTGAWQRALNGLTEENLEEALGDVLNKRRRAALLERRDDIAALEPGVDRAAMLSSEAASSR